MRLNFQLSLLLCFIAVVTNAQNDQPPSLNIGDPAPPLRVRGWIKGTPVKKFEKGKVYVLEFWATWCAPCKAAMPHLSALAREYKDRVTIIGIDVRETKTTPLKRVKAFVDSMGHRMDYNVAAMDSNVMVSAWMDASGEYGIPHSFVVNGEGRLAWIGYPTGLNEVLPKIVDNTWSIREALDKRNSDKYLAKLDRETYEKVSRYLGDPYKTGDLGKPDSILSVVNEIVRHEPKLKYAPSVGYHTFSSLLKTNLHEAYEYGKVLLVTSTYEEPACYSIIYPIQLLSDKLNLPVEMYRLGAEAYRLRIGQIPFTELVNLPRLYNNMAEWYCRANDKSKAIDAQHKAIEALKSKQAYEAMKTRKTVVAAEIALFGLRLQHYKSM